MSQHSPPQNQAQSANVGDSNTNEKAPLPKKPTNAAVTDSTAMNSRELLNAYVYDFLIKSGLPNTAKAFFQEADVPVVQNQDDKANGSRSNSPKGGISEVPPLMMSMDAPQGFLYEWWQIFWDVFNARTHRGGSANAHQYFQLNLLKQRQEHPLNSQMQMVQNGHNQQQMAGSPIPMQPGMMHTGVPPQMMNKRGNVNGMNIQQQQQQQGAMNARLQQQVAQQQMNNLRQQQDQQQGQQVQGGSPAKRARLGDNDSGDGSAGHGSPLGPNSVPPQAGMVTGQFNSQYAPIYQKQAGAPVGSNPQQPQHMMPNFQPPQGIVNNSVLHAQQKMMGGPEEFYAETFNGLVGNGGAGGPTGVQPPSGQPKADPGSQPQPQNSQSPASMPQQPNSQHGQPNDPAAQGIAIQQHIGGARGNASAIRDYEKQLRLMESQNRRRLDVHRNTEAKGDNQRGATGTQFADYSAMLGQLGQQGAVPGGNSQPNAQRPNGSQPMTNMPPPQNTLISRTTPASSPAVSSNQTGTTTANGRKKKEPAQGRRGRKGSVAQANAEVMESVPTPTTPLTPAASQTTPQGTQSTPQHNNASTAPARRITKRKSSQNTKAAAITLAAQQAAAQAQNPNHENGLALADASGESTVVDPALASYDANGKSDGKGPLLVNGGQGPSSDIPTDNQFFPDFSATGASADLFDFDSFLTGDATDSNSGGLALNEMFNWGESVETADM
ncbi:unnamed protein product [Kuraishia capsulata CBS 1993]|uniref:Uncharacterized protein n=1 Tax=Kuraishia capsulata CBS 1993 TaxID=1382522 RepID=W6MFM2_9ASCO|nr:uncharacterized protein KUCA_T00000610001 [Kuraishia capsulata CBS 1993]CDK24644.1 unnamed protein product [Kuraishia capsulata CBS 1993]